MATKKPATPMTMQEVAVKLREQFIAVAGKQANDVDLNAVTNEVIADLNASKREVTLKLLGLDNRWGKWEVDHCNGRKSPVGDLLDAESTRLVKEWVNQAVKEVLTEEMRLKMKAQIRAAFTKELTSIDGYKTREMIYNAAGSVVSGMVKEVKHEFEVELGIKE